MNELRSIGVFCGSSDGVAEGYLALAREVGQRLAADQMQVVYGGGVSGLMGAVATSAMEAGGHVIGVIPGGLFTNEIPHDHISELHTVADMHERKTMMYRLSDGFIALPGGLGTLEEVFEAATWTQLGLHSEQRPRTMVLLDTTGYWQPIVDLLDHATEIGFIRPKNRAIIRAASTIDEALAILRDPPSREAPNYVTR